MSRNQQEMYRIYTKGNIYILLTHIIWLEQREKHTLVLGKKSLNITEMQIHPKILLKLFAISVKKRIIFTKIIFKFIRKNKFMKSEGKCEK